VELVYDGGVHTVVKPLAKLSGPDRTKQNIPLRKPRNLLHRRLRSWHTNVTRPEKPWPIPRLPIFSIGLTSDGTIALRQGTCSHY
jgi:hypothetical protein